MIAEERKMREREFHDRRFGVADGSRPVLETAYRLMLPANRRYHQAMEAVRPLGRVLDYGCGNGDNALVFARRGLDITGIDISRSGVEHARAEAARVGLDTEFRVMDAEDLDFPDNTFAAVSGKGILHHLNLDRALTEIGRVLTPAGRAVFIEPLGHNPFINWYRRRTPEARTPDERPLRAADLDRVRTYFRDVTFTYFNLTTLCALPFGDGETFETVFSLCDRLDGWLLGAFPWLGRYSWVVFMDMRNPVKPSGRQ
jgi:SAM-dependent methyltransferase